MSASGSIRSESVGEGWSLPPSPSPIVRTGPHAPPQQSNSPQSPQPQQHEPARKIHRAMKAVFDHEDAVRQAMKARLQQLGDMVNLSAQALDEEASGSKLVEGCRSLTNEAASLSKQIAQRQIELDAELQNCRRSRLVYSGAPGRLPPERHSALTNEIDMLRDEVKSFRLRERQLLSQVKMLGGDASSRATSSPGSVLQPEVASEMMRLNEEVATLRSERELWRTRALAAEAKLLIPEVPAADGRFVASEGTGEKELRSLDSGGHGDAHGDARAPSAASVDPVALAFEAARGGRRDARAPSAASLDPVALAFEAARSGMMREPAFEDGGGCRPEGGAEVRGKDSGHGIGSSHGADASHPRYPVWSEKNLAMYTSSTHIHTHTHAHKHTHKHTHATHERIFLASRTRVHAWLCAP